MKILITGANGYIGKSLFNAFKDKYEVTAITRKDFDLTNTKSTINFFEEKYFDVVLHCAISGGSRLKEDMWDIAYNNIYMYYNLKKCKSKFSKLINFTSGAEDYYFDTAYGFSKKIISDLVLNTENFFNIKIYAIFDENELDTRFIKSNIKRYINKEPIVIHKDRFMDFFYMKDLQLLIDFYIKNISLPKEIDCAYSNKITLLDISKIINNLDDYKSNIILLEEGNDKPYLGKPNSLLNYIGLEKGIKNVFNKLKYDN